MIGVGNLRVDVLFLALDAGAATAAIELLMERHELGVDVLFL